MYAKRDVTFKYCFCKRLPALLFGETKALCIIQYSTERGGGGGGGGGGDLALSSFSVSSSSFSSLFSSALPQRFLCHMASEHLLKPAVPKS